jgi:hypothetical protein
VRALSKALGMPAAQTWFLPTICSLGVVVALTASPGAQERNELRAASTFAGIQDTSARSRALFSEAAKVITNPRCVNCHPAADHPLQGDDQHIHQPPVYRGEAGSGVPGLHCAACHSDRNFNLSEEASYQSIPGNPRWGLAPIEMA